MLCKSCKNRIPDDSLFCPFCGDSVVEIEKKGITEDDERVKLTNDQRYFDDDYGYSSGNPVIVSSVQTMGFYLSALRTENGEEIKWVFEPYDEDKQIIKYNLFVNNEYFNSIYFNPHGNDTQYAPKGLVFEEMAFEAAKRGISFDEYQKELAEQQHQKEVKLAIEREEATKKEKKKEEKKIKAKKKLKRLIIISIPVLVIAILVVLGLVFRDFTKYAYGYIQLKLGNYEKAISIFSSIEDYNDSLDKERESYYLYGEDFLGQCQYQDAITNYEQARGFGDSLEKIRECRYQIGLSAFDREDYLSADNELSEIIGYSYKDSRALFIKSNYFLMCQEYQAKEYIKAYEYYEKFSHLNDFIDLLSGYDLSFIEDMKICCSLDLIKSKKDKELNQAKSILSGLKQAGARDERIDKAIKSCDEQLVQNKYDNAMELLKTKDYIAAIEVFETIKDFSDAANQIIEAKYQYVCYKKKDVIIYENCLYLWLEDDDGWSRRSDWVAQKKFSTFYSYARELAELDYKDIKAYYNELTKWRVEIIINNDEEDSETPMSNLSVYDTFLAHIHVSGGEYGERIKLKHKITFPDGSVLQDEWDEEMKMGFERTFGGYYNDPARGTVGTAYFEVLDMNGHTLAKKQVRIVY